MLCEHGEEYPHSYEYIPGGEYKALTTWCEGPVEEEGWNFPEDLLEAAWGIIANASDWQVHEGWTKAAERWRDAYFGACVIDYAYAEPIPWCAVHQEETMLANPWMKADLNAVRYCATGWRTGTVCRPEKPQLVYRIKSGLAAGLTDEP